MVRPVDDHHSRVEEIIGRNIPFGGFSQYELVQAITDGDDLRAIEEGARVPVVEADDVGVEVQDVFGVDQVEEAELEVMRSFEAGLYQIALCEDDGLQAGAGAKFSCGQVRHARMAADADGD